MDKKIPWRWQIEVLGTSRVNVEYWDIICVLQEAHLATENTQREEKMYTHVKPKFWQYQ